MIDLKQVINIYTNKCTCNFLTGPIHLTAFFQQNLPLKEVYFYFTILSVLEEPPANECTSYPCLIFEDNFDSLDFNKWKHEITLGGGGVSN